MDVPDDPMTVLSREQDHIFALSKQEYHRFVRFGLLFAFVILGLSLTESNVIARSFAQGLFVLYVLALLIAPITGDR